MSDIDFIQPKKKVGEMISVSVLEDIKAEINEIYCGYYCDNPYTAGEVREKALEIIDSHISGKDEE